MDWLSWLLLCATCWTQGMDVQLLPASFRSVEADLNVSPMTLAALAFSQGLAVTCSGPMWANLADRGHPVKPIMVSGIVGWGVATMLLASASSISTMIALRVVNGICLGMLGSVMQSVVAGEVEQEKAGFVFGILDMVLMLGQFTAIVESQLSLKKRFSACRVGFSLFFLLEP
ncbi:unnamed protein product [Polarella glacialis]|uniref:Major facilitator superfamily (MFS) profile domain-containing protein n=1 Tax=Polarella glacialis TaxID=89957 RepID=A0A813HCE9_POLGL|nr:unnamed protein product [Polarella glacialis]